MPVFYVPWDKVIELQIILDLAEAVAAGQADPKHSENIQGWIDAMRDQIEQEWAKDKDSYERFVERGKTYDESTRGLSKTSGSDDNRGISRTGKGYSQEQVPSEASKEGGGEEEEHF